MKYIYGPVQSRRLGLSLGLSLTPYKTCSFDCVYCQLGKTINFSVRQQEYIPVKEILDELKSWLQNNPQEAQKLNYISFSGAGEPTLNIKFGELAVEIKRLVSVPIAVITNASLLKIPSVRQALSAVDLIVPSLDAVNPDIFQKIDRPHAGIKVEDVIEGLVSLRKEFRGKIWLEVMLVKGINDDLRHIKKLKEVIDRINPDKIQINSPVRTTTEPDALPVDKNKLEKIKEILGEKAQIL
jgi:wyosine [tRNA(Phe)-imidazoG37] synthetase (radical SAM superfamily)